MAEAMSANSRPFLAFCSTMMMVLPSTFCRSSRISKTMSMKRGSRPIEGSSTSSTSGSMTSAGDLQQAPLAAGQHLGRVLAALGQARVLVEDLLGALLGLGRLVLQVAAHPEVLLHGHAGEDRLVLQDVGDAGRAQLVLRRQLGRCPLACRRPIDLAAEDVGEAEDRVQHVDLPAPFGPIRQSDWPPDLQIEVVQDLHLAVAGAQILDVDIGLVPGQRRPARLGRRPRRWRRPGG